MSNKIIEEQRRAREEEIKLKQMKQGLIEVEHKDEAAVIIPKLQKKSCKIIGTILNGIPLARLHL